MPPVKKDVLDLALDLDRLMRLLHCTMRPRLVAADPFGIGPFGAMVLLSIADLEPVPVNKLSSHVGRDKAQMTRTIQALESYGLVGRRRSASDGRVSLVELTDPGRELVGHFHSILSEIVGDLVEGLNDRERTQFAGLLAKAMASKNV